MNLALAAAETFLNGCLALDPLTRDALRRMPETWIEIQLQGLEKRLFAGITPAGINLVANREQTPDVILQGSPLDLLALLGPSGDRLLFEQKVVLRGDTQRGQEIRRVMRNAQVDWEEWVAKLTGDLVAHQLGSWVRHVAAWGREVGEHRVRDGADFLQEEKRVLPAPAEVECWIQDVDALRMDVDRLDARLKRLDRYWVTS